MRQLGLVGLDRKTDSLLGETVVEKE